MNDVEQEWFKGLCAEVGVKEVWLFGSRANGEERDDSDWDFMVFGDLSLLEKLESNSHERFGTFDLLVVYDGNNFRGPWPRKSDGAFKHGNLSNWEWQEISPGVAHYKATKKVLNRKFDVSVRKLKAMKFFP